jgi:hypothetical protein
MAEIAERAECSIGLVSNVLCNHQEFGQVNNPFKRYTGRPSSLTEDDLNFIHAILSANPSLYLDEIQQKLSAVRAYRSLCWVFICQLSARQSPGFVVYMFLNGYSTSVAKFWHVHTHGCKL